jgi:CubicO group peptidase (beta-lactamase class C family)
MGVDARAFEAMLDEIQAAGLEVHSLMLHRRGHVVAEGFWWPYRPEQRRIMHSFAKSVTAAAVGLAIEDGRFRLGDKVISFFPEMIPAEVDPKLAALTVEDLLTMRTGHEAEVGGSLWRAIDSSWIAEFFKIPVVEEPGAKHVYSSAASYMLAAILHRATGQTLHEYLRPRIFEPLGIEGETWDVGPDGINPGGNGLSCKTVDVLKFCILHGQKGLWNGQRLVPERWVAEATRPHESGGYGYHWQTYPGGAYAGIGLFVQMGLVLPQYDAVLAVMGAMEESAVIRPVFDRHYPTIFRDEAFEAPEADARLAERLASLAAPRRLYSRASPAAERISGATWIAEDNPMGISEVRIDCGAAACTFTLVDDGGAHTMTADIGGWREGVSTMPGRELHHGYALDGAPIVAGARWVDERTLELTWIFVGSAFRDTVVCQVDGDHLSVDRSVNVNSAARRLPTLICRRR